MQPEAQIHTERIDDLPLLLSQQQQMGIPQILNKIIQPHGNRQGLSVGWLTTTWLSYILSAGDHRMVEVEPWVAAQQATLSGLIPESLGLKDFTDDRLADVLGVLSQDALWEEVEVQLGQHLIRVYDLADDRIRLDSTSVSVYHEEASQPLFRAGHSKDHRPDLAQFKLMLGTLDPLGMPLASLVVAGNGADDPLYLPAWARVRPVVGPGQKLYIGDTKMGALQTRAVIQEGGDYYLMPLAQVGEVPQLLQERLQPVWAGDQALQRIEAVDAGEEAALPMETEAWAQAFEGNRPQQACVEGHDLRFDERVLVVHSPALARKGQRGLEARLSRSEAVLHALTPPRGRGKKQWADQSALEEAVQTVLNKHRVEGLLEVSYTQQVDRRSIRTYNDRPARQEERLRYTVEVQPQAEAIQQARRRLGWRLYVTNAPPSALSLAQAVRAYRGAPHIERNFARLKGRALGIRPLYVQREDHAKGMVRLLSLALRVLTLTEYVVREKLHAAGETLTGLYAGNPKRKTARPTTERVLKAFKGIVLTVVQLPDQTIRHVTPLSKLQRWILNLLGLPDSIYEKLTLSDEPIPI